MGSVAPSDDVHCIAAEDDDGDEDEGAIPVQKDASAIGSSQSSIVSTVCWAR